MADKYELKDKCDFLGGRDLFGVPVTPHEYDVKDKDSGKTIGSVTAWDEKQAGGKIASGDIKPKN